MGGGFQWVLGSRSMSKNRFFLPESCWTNFRRVQELYLWASNQDSFSGQNTGSTSQLTQYKRLTLGSPSPSHEPNRRDE